MSMHPHLHLLSSLIGTIPNAGSSPFKCFCQSKSVTGSFLVNDLASCFPFSDSSSVIFVCPYAVCRPANTSLNLSNIFHSHVWGDISITPVNSFIYLLSFDRIVLLFHT